MTVPPSTAERFAIVPVTHGPAPADAIVTGSMSAVMEYIPQSVARQDAVEELEKARFSADQIAGLQEKTRGVQASMLADSVNHLSARLDTFLQRKADEARQRAAEEEEAEAKRIQDELAALPDPDDPGVHQNTGDLHNLLAKDQKEEEPEIEDQAEFELPEDPSGPKGTVVPQPVSISFD